MVLKPNEMKISKKKNPLQTKVLVKSNENFEKSYAWMCKYKKKHEDSTWISEEFIEAYTNLFELDIAFLLKYI